MKRAKNKPQKKFFDWVNTNRRKVDQATGGQVGYIHIPDMGNNGIREFIKWYYPQIRKESFGYRRARKRRRQRFTNAHLLIGRLRRRLLAVNYARTDDEANTYPDAVFIGPMVTLLDQNSASDGDIFPYMFREAGLGGASRWFRTESLLQHVGAFSIFK